MITERDVHILRVLARYYLLTRQQVERLCFKDAASSRVARRRLQVLVDASLIQRYALFAYHPTLGSPAPVYYLSHKGAEFLASHFDDARFLATNTQPPQSNLVLHWLAIGDTHIALEEAIARQEEVQLKGWINEFDVVNKAEARPERRFQLYLLLREEPRLICAPDAAFMLEARSYRKVYYLEQDRATSGVQHVAASKTPGYAVMAEQELHRRHFPETNVNTFGVLMVTPSINRRNHLTKAFRGKPGAALWKFAAAPDLTPERVLHAPIWHPVEGETHALVKATPKPSDEKQEASVN